MTVSDDDRSDGQTDVPSDLDQNTHAELQLLYQDAARSLRHIKDRQWKVTGGALLLFAAIMALTRFLPVDAVVAKLLVMATFLVSAATIYILIIYQVAQHAELGRIQAVSARFSTLFMRIGGARGRGDSRVHGYIFLFLMIAAIVTANAVAVIFLSRLY